MIILVTHYLQTHYSKIHHIAQKFEFQYVKTLCTVTSLNAGEKMTTSCHQLNLLLNLIDNPEFSTINSIPNEVSFAYKSVMYNYLTLQNDITTGMPTPLYNMNH